MVVQVEGSAQRELEFPLIKHEEEGEIIFQRIQDGYVNATAMCKAVGKQFNDYTRLRTTPEYLSELSAETGIPVSGLIESIKGGTPSLQGTWVHPQVAIHLGQWLSPKFAVRVAKWVFEWMTGKTPQNTIPYHLRRYMENIPRIPSGYESDLEDEDSHPKAIDILEKLGYFMSHFCWAVMPLEGSTKSTESLIETAGMHLSTVEGFIL